MTPYIDWECCLEAANHKSDLAEEMLALFMAELPKTADTIKTAWQSQKWQALCDILHYLHGGCCYTGVPSLQSKTLQLEKQLLQGDLNVAIGVQELLNLITDILAEYQTQRGIT